jgi:hypothetical protein
VILRLGKPRANRRSAQISVREVTSFQRTLFAIIVQANRQAASLRPSGESLITDPSRVFSGLGIWKRTRAAGAAGSRGSTETRPKPGRPPAGPPRSRAALAVSHCREGTALTVLSCGVSFQPEPGTAARAASGGLTPSDPGHEGRHRGFIALGIEACSGTVQSNLTVAWARNTRLIAPGSAWRRRNRRGGNFRLGAGLRTVGKMPLARFLGL